RLPGWRNRPGRRTVLETWNESRDMPAPPMRSRADVAHWNQSFNSSPHVLSMIACQPDNGYESPENAGSLRESIMPGSLQQRIFTKIRPSPKAFAKLHLHLTRI